MMIGKRAPNALRGSVPTSRQRLIDDRNAVVEESNHHRNRRLRGEFVLVEGSRPGEVFNNELETAGLCIGNLGRFLRVQRTGRVDREHAVGARRKARDHEHLNAGQL